MREHKFKAWDKYNKCWLNLFELVLNIDGKVMAVRTINGEVYGMHQVDLVDYTGSKDRKGVEVYEGDVVSRLEDCLGEIEALYTVCFGIYDNGHTYEMRVDGWYLNGEGDLVTEGLVVGADFEVIGNIHSNPELVGGK